MALNERAATSGPEKGCFVKVYAKEGSLLTEEKEFGSGGKISRERKHFLW
jgi:hypothetical protein